VTIAADATLDALPLPVPRPERTPGLVGGLVGRIPGVARSLRQVVEFGEHWDAHNDAVLASMLDAAPPAGRWWAVLGDSAAQGVGASGPDRGWAGVVAAELGLDAWFNLSVSGAKLADVAAVQVPRLAWLVERLGAPERVLVAAGGNDLVRAVDTRGVRADLEQLVGLLPAGSVVAAVPQTPWGLLARSANAALHGLARERDVVVADINRHYRFPYSRRTASDAFHPNDRGYREWARAFTEVLSG